MNRSNNIITLITDFGASDIFVGVMKGGILNINPEAKIIDITHEIEPQDVIGGAFLLGSSYRYFPRGTVHLSVIDPGVGSERRAITVETEDYYFVTPDNGSLSHVLAEDAVRKAIELSNPDYFLPEISDTFHGRDIFAPVAAHISKGVPLENLGEIVTDLVKLPILTPQTSDDRIIAHVIYIDRFGNLITNISKSVFGKARRERDFVISIKDKQINQIKRAYSEVPTGELLGIFSSFGNLEIAVNGGNAAKNLGVEKGAPVEISLR